MKEKKGKPRGFFIALFVLLLLFFIFQSLGSTKPVGVSFSYQVEHLLNLDLIDKEQCRKIAINDSLVTFSGKFKDTLSDDANNRYHYLELLDNHNRLSLEKNRLKEGLAAERTNVYEAATFFLQITGNKLPKHGYQVVDSIYDMPDLENAVVIMSVPEKNIATLEQLQLRNKNGFTSLDEVNLFGRDLHKLISTFQSSALGIGDENLKKTVRAAEVEVANALKEDASLDMQAKLTVYQKALSDMGNVAQTLQADNHGVRLLGLRSVQFYKDNIEKYDYIANELEKNDLKLDKIRANVADVIWFFNNSEISTRMLETQDPEAFSRWFNQAAQEWSAYPRNAGSTFKAPGQPRTLALEKNFKSEESASRYFDYLVPIVTFGGLILFLFYFMGARQKGGVGGAMTFGKSPAKLWDNTKNRVTFADVAGCDEAKEELMEIVDFLKDPNKFTSLGARIPKGVLCVGAPGTGKTLIARAVAGEADRPFFSISGSDFVEMFVGVGASRIRDMFEQAKRNAPCIIFVDEIDAVGRHRGSGIGGGHDEREQTLNQLLVEMDGFDTNEGIILIAATNRPDVLDKALLRPGRFDRRIIVELPDLRGRFEIIKVHAKKIKMDASVDLMHLARNTPGASGADLANILNEAALLAARRGRKAVTEQEMVEASDKVRYGKERRSLDIDKKEKATTAYHESGHAVVALTVKHADPVDKVTIIPRGAALGATHFMPTKNKLSYWRSELIDQIAILMGGRAAEEVFLNDMSSGAQMDILQSTKLARCMVCEWGMTDLGVVTYDEHAESGQYLGLGSYHEKNYSDETAQKIDAEVKKIVEEGHAQALKIIGEKRNELELMKTMLEEFETLDQIDVQEIIKGEWTIENKRRRLQEAEDRQKKPALSTDLSNETPLPNPT